MKREITAQEALERLKKGNVLYLTAQSNDGDISPAIREKTCREGQSPYAVVVACSDSRVIPESIFSAGIGELFVIRVAGNVVDRHLLGSVEYAVSHLGCPLVVVLGHNHCGAVGAALEGGAHGYIKDITDEILLAVGQERDGDRACRLNVRRSANRISEVLQGAAEVVGAVYRLENGAVEFLLPMKF